MLFRQLYDQETSTYTYLLADEQTKEAVLIDPVLEQVDRDLQLLKELGLTLKYALDTHVHADHVTGLGTLRERTGCKTVLSERAGTGCADLLVKQGDKLSFGSHALEVRETPGHTNGCVTYVTDDQKRAFTGDAVLIRGCGRTDFQQGSSQTLYHSVHSQVFTLPDSTELFPGHDYKGRTVSTVGEEKALNPRLGTGKTEAEFVELMANLQLAYPKKINVALPANLQCGVPRGATVNGEEMNERIPQWAPVVTSAGGIPEVEPAWVFANGKTVSLIDVREPAEFNAELGHVAGARLVPLATVENAMASVDRATPIVLLCRSGGRSGKAALALRAMGFTQIASMRGGMLAWNAQKLTIERNLEARA